MNNNYKHFSKLNDDNSCTYGYEHAFWDVVETCDGNYAVVGEVGQLTTYELPKVEPGSARYGVNRLTEILGEDYNDLEVEEDSTVLNYESPAAVLVKYDNNGNVEWSRSLYRDRFARTTSLAVSRIITATRQSQSAACSSRQMPRRVCSSTSLRRWDSMLSRAWDIGSTMAARLRVSTTTDR